jgi:hypothetical protein
METQTANSKTTLQPQTLSILDDPSPQKPLAAHGKQLKSTGTM